MFQSCVNLKKIPNFDTFNVETMENTFYNCVKLRKKPELNMNKVKKDKNMYGNCVLLEKISKHKQEKINKKIERKQKDIFNDIKNINKLNEISF